MKNIKNFPNKIDSKLVNEKLLLSSKFIESKKFNIAINILEDLDKKFSEIPEVIYNFALSYYNEGVRFFNNKYYQISLQYLKNAELYFEKIKNKDFLFDVYIKLSICNRKENNYFEVLKYHKKLFKLDNKSDFTLSLLMYSKQKLADWEGIEKLFEKAKIRLDEKASSLTPFSSLLLSDDLNVQLKSATNYSKAYINSKNKFSFHHPERTRRKKIKVAFLSADFYEHATLYLIAGVFEKLNHNDFDYYAISYAEKSDDSIIFQRVKKSFANFYLLNDKTDQEIAEFLYELEIDIVIDLKGHTKNNRIGILKNKPCPIQISYLGYPGTLGTDFIDYLILDKFIVNDENRKYFSENIIFLPNSYQCNDDNKPKLIDLKRKDFNLPEDKFVLCSLNNGQKYNKNILNVWIGILKKNANTVLWIINDPGIKENVLKYMHDSGIEKSRIILSPRVDYNLHISRLTLADLFIDSFPCNAHTTASDALYANLPIITVSGKSMASRVTGSLLSVIKLNHLICKDFEEYYTKINFYINNQIELKILKKYIKDNKFILYNSEVFTRNLEKSFTKVWQNYLNNKTYKDIII